MKNKGLGRGLGAILEAENYSEAIEAVNHMEDIGIDLIVPNPKQPRQTFDDNALEELADSISTLGLIQPITVKKIDDSHYESSAASVVGGHRVWQARRALRPIFARPTTNSCTRCRWSRTFNAKTSTLWR